MGGRGLNPSMPTKISALSLYDATKAHKLKNAWW
jgi:hypothetical protein